MTASRRAGALAFLGFMACIPAANYLVGHVGTVCVPHGPCLIPVAPSLMAPSGVVTVGLALVLRDMVQRFLGLGWSFAAIALGTLASAAFADRSLLVASGIAFFLSEMADLVVYTPLQKRRLIVAVVASASAGLVVDSVAFLWLAFGSLDFLAGQIVGKAWAVLVSIPLISATRRMTPAPT